MVHVTNNKLSPPPPGGYSLKGSNLVLPLWIRRQPTEFLLCGRRKRAFAWTLSLSLSVISRPPSLGLILSCVGRLRNYSYVSSWPSPCRPAGRFLSASPTSGSRRGPCRPPMRACWRPGQHPCWAAQTSRRARRCDPHDVDGTLGGPGWSPLLLRSSWHAAPPGGKRCQSAGQKSRSK